MAADWVGEGWGGKGAMNSVGLWKELRFLSLLTTLSIFSLVLGRFLI